MKKYKPNKTRITNKIFSLVFIAVGIATMMATDGDMTFLMFTSPIAIWLFFSKDPVMGV